MKKTYSALALLASFLMFLIAARGSQEEIELKFSHAYHVAEEEIECITCHEMAETSTTCGENVFPTMETCADCHDVEDEETCNTCHSNVDEPGEIPRIENYSRKFSHEKHLGSGLDCASCHAEVAAKTAAAPFVLPVMTECMACHEQKLAANDCATCHMPEDRLMPANHTEEFIHNHSDLARAGANMAALEKNCMSCHQPQFCQTCHEGDNLDRRTHDLNFEFTHALAAQGKERDCAVCHTQRSFCIDCHSDNQVLPHNHTPGWAVPIAGGRHRVEALNDLENCMACHEQNADRVCQTCHGN